LGLPGGGEPADALGVEECHSSGWCLVFKGKHHPEGKNMRVFVAGATGALGRHLVPGLVAAGHEVTATTRTPGKGARLHEAGAEPVVVDGLDREEVIAAVRAAGPEVIVHQMTALTGVRSLRKPDQAFAATNELRARGTDNLLAAIRHVEETVPLAAPEGIVPRYGGFYGPGASELLVDLVRKGGAPGA